MTRPPRLSSATSPANCTLLNAGVGTTLAEPELAVARFLCRIDDFKFASAFAARRAAPVCGGAHTLVGSPSRWMPTRQCRCSGAARPRARTSTRRSAANNGSQTRATSAPGARAPRGSCACIATITGAYGWDCHTLTTDIGTGAASAFAPVSAATSAFDRLDLCARPTAPTPPPALVAIGMRNIKLSVPPCSTCGSGRRVDMRGGRRDRRRRCCTKHAAIRRCIATFLQSIHRVAPPLTSVNCPAGHALHEEKPSNC